MSRREELPSPALLAAHVRSSHHRREVERSEVCGCFSCLELFRPSEVRQWIDKDMTALCPRCGADAVLPSLVSLSPAFLGEMRAYWRGASD